MERFSKGIYKDTDKGMRKRSNTTNSSSNNRSSSSNSSSSTLPSAEVKSDRDDEDQTVSPSKRSKKGAQQQIVTAAEATNADTRVFVPVVTLRSGDNLSRDRFSRIVGQEEVAVQVLGSFTSETVAFRRLAQFCFSDPSASRSVSIMWDSKKAEAKRTGALGNKEVFKNSKHPAPEEIVNYLVEARVRQFAVDRRSSSLESTVKLLENECFDYGNFLYHHQRLSAEIKQFTLDTSTEVSSK
jgi:hypothetical protein